MRDEVFRGHGLSVTCPPWTTTLDPDREYPLESPEGRQACGASPPAVVHLTVGYVATLPDGSVIAVPAGTVLHEQR